ncbi:hypothetical protein V2J09_003539 [Rumex salicifolius]
MAANTVNSSGSGSLARVSEQLRLFGPPFSADKFTLGFSVAAEGRNEGKLVISHGNPTSSPKRSAVLVCIFEGDNGELRVILTKRSSKLSSHAGEVALPGGKADEGDEDDAATALREADEEIGLNPSLVDVVTVLDPITMKFGMKVVPVVGILADKKSFHPNLNPDEVDDIFDAPLEMFLKDENRREEEREWMGDKYLLHFFDYEGGNGKSYTIYALTAGILVNAASVVYRRSPDFKLGLPNFWITNTATARVHVVST